MSNFKFYLEKVQSLNEMPVYSGNANLSREFKQRELNSESNIRNIERKIRNLITVSEDGEKQSDGEIKAGTSLFDANVKIEIVKTQVGFKIEIRNCEDSNFDLDVDAIAKATNSKYDKKASKLWGYHSDLFFTFLQVVDGLA